MRTSRRFGPAPEFARARRAHGPRSYKGPQHGRRRTPGPGRPAQRRAPLRSTTTTHTRGTIGPSWEPRPPRDPRRDDPPSDHDYDEEENESHDGPDSPAYVRPNVPASRGRGLAPPPYVGPRVPPSIPRGDECPASTRRRPAHEDLPPWYRRSAVVRSSSLAVTNPGRSAGNSVRRRRGRYHLWHTRQISTIPLPRGTLQARDFACPHGRAAGSGQTAKMGSGIASVTDVPPPRAREESRVHRRAGRSLRTSPGHGPAAPRAPFATSRGIEPLERS